MRRIYSFTGALLIAGVFWIPAEGQRATFTNAAGESLTPRHLARGTLWHSFLSTGAEGARPVEGNYAGLYLDLAYPGFALISWGGGGTNDFSSYYGDQRSAGSMHVDLTSHNGRGHGWWIATKVNGQAEVSWADPLIAAMEESEDVVAMAVDPGVDFKGRYAGLGNDVVSPNSGRSMANWWPGTGVELDALEPREILNYRIGQYNDVSTDNYPEDIVLSKWTTGLGITGEKAAFAWNHPDYDDFVITEWVFENTGDTDGDRAADLPGGGHNLTNVYFSFHHRFMTSSPGVSRTSYRAYYSDYGTGDGCSSNFGPLDNSQDDKIKYTEAPNYDGPASARGLRLTYQYDWNNFCLTGPLADDIGDPYRSEHRCAQCTFPSLIGVGDLTSPAWIGKAPIDVDPTDGFVGDPEVYEAPKVAEQPFAYNFFHFLYRYPSSASDAVGFLTDEPNPNEMNHETLYQMLVSTPEPSYFDQPLLERPSRGSGNPNLGVPLLPVPDVPVGPMPYMPIPTWEWEGRHGIAAAYTPMETYGPYDLAPGQKVKFVFAYVAAAPVTENFRAFQKSGDSSELKKEENGAAFTNLLNHLNKAKEAYALGYDLPNQPPDVDAMVTSSENARNLITWSGDPEKSINPDTGQSDVAGYRVYQSETQPGIWKLIEDVSATGAQDYAYEDTESLAGFQYYYAVRSYQGSGNTGFVSRVTGATVEGGVRAYESGIGDVSTYYLPPSGSAPDSPVQVPTASADRLEKDILIVPNPFIPLAPHTYEGSTKIRILNVPRKAKIRIFSVAGDLVGEVDHDSQTEGEAAFFQFNRTHITQLTFGVYFVTVESLLPGTEGQVKGAKLVIIR